MITTTTKNRYLLCTLMFDELRDTNKYKAIHEQIINNGYFGISNGEKLAHIYTPELSYFLFSEEIKAFNLENQVDETISGMTYLEAYIDAYKQGESYFDTEFKVTISTLYGDNSELYLKDIHDNYFHIEHFPPHKGWYFVKNSFPSIITEKSIFNFGYYSGIIAKADQLFDKYSNVFDKVRTCERGDAAQNKVQKTVLNFVHNVSDKENFIKDLTTAFNKDEDRGRTIKAVINFLEEAGIFIIPDRQLKTFLTLLQVEFTQNIGSYTSINDAEKKNRFDDQFLNPIKTILKPLIDNHKK